jgi:prephenate dehydrogenase
MTPKKIGIIGVNGKYGRWLKNFFETHGCSVLGSDIGTTLTNRDVVEGAEVIIFSVPIDSIENVVREVIPFSGEAQLWMDVTSLKTPVINAMFYSEASVVGLHPLCAPPQGNTLVGETLVVCVSVIDKNWHSWFDSFLADTKATVKYCEPEEHDEYMAVVQALPHALALLMAKVLRDLEVKVGEARTFQTSFSKIIFTLIGRILSRDPKLYSRIQIDNPEVEKVLSALSENLNALLHMVRTNDSDALIKMMEECKAHFGEGEIAHSSLAFEDLSREG